MLTIKYNGNVKLKRGNGFYVVLKNGLNVYENEDFDAALAVFRFHCGE